MRGFALAAVLLGVAGMLPPATAQATKKLKIGIPQSTFRDVPAAVVEAAASPFRDLFKKQAGLDGDVELLPNHDALAAQMQAKKIDVGVFTSFEFAWVRQAHPDLAALVVAVPSGRKMQAILVVHKDDKATKPADLAGDTVAIPNGMKPHGHLYIERLRATLPANCCGTAKVATMGAEDILDAIASKRLQAGLVDIAALTAYQNNSAEGHAQLRVLAESELFPPGVIAYRKGGLDAATVSKMHAGLLKASGTPQGRAFMLLSKMKGFEDVPADFDAELKRIAAAYPPAPPK